MNTTAMPNSTHDVYNQSFLLDLADGSQIPFSLDDLDNWYIYAVWSCIQYATQLGASFILFVVLVLLTKPEKRTNLLFLLNSTALVFNILRMILTCCYFTGPFNEVYNYLGNDYSTLPSSAYGVSIAASIFSGLLLLVVQVSLLMQIHVVCITLRKIYRQALLIFSAVIAGGTVASKFYLVAVNIKDILNPEGSTADETIIHTFTNIIMTVALFWFSAIFVTKLGYALHQRRKLGLYRWGSMQIIFIMGCQTLVIPAIFSLVQHLVVFPAIGSFELTLVALFLPLSSLWASSAVDGTSKQDIVFTAHRKVAPSYTASSSPKSNNLSISVGGSTQCTSDIGSPVIKNFKETHELV